MNYFTTNGHAISKRFLTPEMARCLSMESRNTINTIVFFQKGEFYQVYGHFARFVSDHLKEIPSTKAATRDNDRIWMFAVAGDVIEEYAEELGRIGYPTALVQTKVVGGKRHNYVRSRFVTD